MLVVAMSALIQRSRSAKELQDELDGTEIEQQQSTETAEVAVQAGTEVTDANVADMLLLTSDAGKREETLVAEPKPILPAEAPVETTFSLEEEAIPQKPVLAASALSSPHALNSATYTALAPGESPYAYGNTVDEVKPKPEPTLLRWSGKNGTIQVGDFTIRGPVAYWSNGPCSTPEPSCIDVTLPVEFPYTDVENEHPSEGAASYNEMTPLQRGYYLRWLAEGRIQPPPHACYPIVWLFGLERRALADRLDTTICIGEAFRLLPLVRWDSLRQGLIKFITWMAARIWLPEEALLSFSQSQLTAPREILNMLLRPYADARLPIPSVVAFTVMRTSSLVEGVLPQPLPHTDDLLTRFSTRYKSKCEGGLVLPKPKASVSVAYTPTNPTLAGDRKLSGGTLELPDFFKEPDTFTTLIDVWREFLNDAFPTTAEPLKASDELEARPDWITFLSHIRGLTDAEVLGQNEEIFTGAAMTSLGALIDLMKIDIPKDGKKIDATTRKRISDAARVEGFLVIPDLGIAGKEYHWEEPVSLTPFPPGDSPSQEYNAAALTLEYACALTGLSDANTLSAMRAGLGSCFSLSSEDDVRLDALSSVLTASAGGESTVNARMNPNNLGETLQFWLQREQRALYGDFLARFLSGFSTQERDWMRLLRESLDVEITPQQVEETAAAAAGTTETKEATKNPQLMELGSKVVTALAPLFTD